MQLSLSTQEVVTLKPVFTHKADKAFSEEMNKDTVYERNDQGQMVAQTLPVLNFDRACEAMLLALVEAVVGPTGVPAAVSRDWLENLPLPDYARLKDAALAMKKEAEERAADGEKKD